MPISSVPTSSAILQGSVRSISAPNSEQWADVCKRTGGCLVLMYRSLSADTSSFPSTMIWPMLAETTVHATLIFISFSTCKVAEDDSRGRQNEECMMQCVSLEVDQIFSCVQMQKTIASPAKKLNESST